MCGYEVLMEEQINSLDELTDRKTAPCKIQ